MRLENAVVAASKRKTKNIPVVAARKQRAVVSAQAQRVYSSRSVVVHLILDIVAQIGRVVGVKTCDAYATVGETH